MVVGDCGFFSRARTVLFLARAESAKEEAFISPLTVPADEVFFILAIAGFHSARCVDFFIAGFPAWIRERAVCDTGAAFSV